MAVAYLSSDTLTGIRTPLCWTPLLPWELRVHPLSVPEWSAEAFLPELEAMLVGDPDAIRRTFHVVNREVRTWDAAHATTACGELVDSWNEELDVFNDES